MFVVLALIFLFVLLLFYDRYCRTTRLVMKIPGPKRLPIIGNSHHFMLPLDELFIYLRTLYKDYGGVVQMHAIVGQGVTLFNPEDIEKIMSSVRYIDKMEPYTFLQPWLGEGLLTSNGMKWHQRRKLLTQAFHFNILKKYSRTFTEQSNEFLKVVEAEVGKAQTDLHPLICSATLHIMCETAMGTSMNVGIESIMKKYFKAIEIVGESVVERLCRVWLYFDSMFKWSNLGRKQQTALKDLHTLTNQIIKERKEFLKDNDVSSLEEDDENFGKKGRLAMLDLLLKNEKLGYIDTEGVREEVDTFMFEGHDTTATALSFLIMAIANESEIQEKIYEEMQSIFGDSQRLATIEDLHEMTYLECCIKESLRLYPSVPIIIRYVTEELILSGYRVPANTGYLIFIYDLHRRADLFPEPERFVPERFLPENCSKRHPYAYIPFSAGPRNCIGNSIHFGQKFAMLEMKTLISSLIRRFRVEPITKPSDLKYKSDLILRYHKEPIYVRFCKR